MYITKLMSKDIASLINTIEVHQEAVNRYSSEKEYDKAAKSRYYRNCAIIRLNRDYRIPHVLLENAVEQNERLAERFA